MSTFLPSPNHTPGRSGVKVDHIVVHWMAGNLAGTDATFARGSSQVSAHYGIEGSAVHQYVRDADTAWHAGTRAENQRSIGIEHSAAPGRPASPATIATSVALIVGLCRKHNISPDHIYGHQKFTATQCPGTLPVAAMIARVRAQLTGVPMPAPKPPVVVRVVNVARKVSGRLAVDGAMGPLTIRRWQQVMGTPADGVISRPSVLVRAVQRRLGVGADGLLGPITWRAIQRRVGSPADGTPGPVTVKALQRRLNTNHF